MHLLVAMLLIHTLQGQEGNKDVCRERQIHCFPSAVLTNLFSLMDKCSVITPSHIFPVEKEKP